MIRKCRDVPLLISRWIDHDLCADETVELASHLSGCDKCLKVWKGYTAQKELIDASFSEKPLTVEGFAMITSARKKRIGAARFFSRYGFVGISGVVLGSLVVAMGMFFPLQHSQSVAHPGVLLECTNTAAMCLPFSSIVYYEDFAGSAVHSQFVRVAPQRTVESEATIVSRISSAARYESPLLGDNAVAVSRAGTADYEDGL